MREVPLYLYVIFNALSQEPVGGIRVQASGVRCDHARPFVPSIKSHFWDAPT